MSWWFCVFFACAAEAPREPVPTEALAPAPEPTPPNEPRYAATHVWITWAGAIDAPVTVYRSKEEARALADDVWRQARGGASLDALARTYSDGPSGPRGGRLGVYATGTLVPEFEAAVAAVPVGSIAPLVETPFGWHVIRRDAVLEASASHVLVTWKGAWRSNAHRSRDDARNRIGEAHAALQSGMSFEDVARSWSEDATARSGGDLGLVAPGQMIPAFEDALFALEPGGVSDVVETPYGFHLVRRGP